VESALQCVMDDPHHPHLDRHWEATRQGEPVQLPTGDWIVSVAVVVVMDSDVVDGKKPEVLVLDWIVSVVVVVVVDSDVVDGKKPEVLVLDWIVSVVVVVVVVDSDVVGGKKPEVLVVVVGGGVVGAAVVGLSSHAAVQIDSALQ
jgi:hypothetical protein